MKTVFGGMSMRRAQGLIDKCRRLGTPLSLDDAGSLCIGSSQSVQISGYLLEQIDEHRDSIHELLRARSTAPTGATIRSFLGRFV